jgi:hypothetical protein
MMNIGCDRPRRRLEAERLDQRAHSTSPLEAIANPTNATDTVARLRNRFAAGLMADDRVFRARSLRAKETDDDVGEQHPYHARPP